MRVLIVEDEPNLGRQLRSTLEGAGYAVDLATDGEDTRGRRVRGRRDRPEKAGGYGLDLPLIRPVAASTSTQITRPSLTNFSR